MYTLGLETRRYTCIECIACMLIYVHCFKSFSLLLSVCRLCVAKTIYLFVAIDDVVKAIKS